MEALLDRCDFPLPGAAVNVAVSGGADSFALLALATTAGLNVTAFHVDHGLREGSDLEAETVAKAAARFEARFESLAVRLDPGPDLEARARAARYSVLPPAVMTGHTMDDQAETVLLNLLRGAGLDGLAGIKRDPSRPLLGLRRSETEALCLEEGLAVLKDPTNDDPRFLRNRVRHELIPLLSDIAGRDVVPVLARQADLLRDEATLLDQLSARLDPTDARGLREAPLPLVRRALRKWLRDPEQGGDDEAHPPSSAEVARVIEVVLGAATACELSGARRVSRSSGRLTVESGSPAKPR
ncbi:MAG TPA: tRNA lysidine(34) synthetase TilS [Acidimicrobiales bacterium]